MLSRMHARFRSADADDVDRGFTLVEMMVVVILVSILGGVVTFGITQSMRSTRQDYNREFSSTQLQSAIERMSRDLRVADPIQYAGAQDVTVDVYRNAKCVRTEYKVSGSNLTWERWTFGSTCAAYPATTGSTDSGALTLVPNVDTTASGTTGTYFTFTNDQGAGGTASSPAAYTRARIIVTATQKEGRASVTLQSTVQFRNHS